jgi:hypothetical protein
MAFRQCNRPAARDLAKSGPTENIYAHLAALDEHHLHWSGQEREAYDAVNVALGTLGAAIHRELFESTAFFKVPVAAARTAKNVERDRRRALGVLGVSMLLRRLIKPDRIYEDAIGMGEDAFDENALVVDMMAVLSRQDVSLHYTTICRKCI